MALSLTQRQDPDAVAALVETLPEWFGVDSANVAYRREAESMPSLFATVGQGRGGCTHVEAPFRARGGDPSPGR